MKTHETDWQQRALDAEAEVQSAEAKVQRLRAEIERLRRTDLLMRCIAGYVRRYQV